MNYDSFSGGVIQGFAGDSSPVLEGNWVNPRTGDYFTVRDCFFEDNNYVVMTTDGRRLDASIIANYVQTKETTAQLQQMKESIREQKSRPEPIPSSIDSMVESDAEMRGEVLYDDPEIAALVRGNSEALNRTFNSAPVQQAPAKPKIKDAEIISRALGKIDAPDIDLDIIFKEYPKQEIQTLIGIMGVELNDIAKWMYEQYFSQDFESIIVGKLRMLLLNGPQTKQSDTQAVNEVKNAEPIKEIAVPEPTKPATTVAKSASKKKPIKKK